MNYNVFPFGFWNYHALGSDVQLPPEADRWAECGMTLTISPTFSYADNTAEEMLAMLDACEKNNIRLIIFIRELEYINSRFEDEYRKTFQRAVDDFGSHPATWGFFVGDEPCDDWMCHFYRAYNIQREMAPNLHPFANFIAGGEYDYIAGTTYNCWLPDYIERCKPELISFDYYAQMCSEPTGVEGYFRCMKYFYETAQRYGIKFWATLLISAHYRCRVPSEDDIIWQISTAVASGVTGIWWYMFYDGLYQGNANYRGAPINVFNEKSDTFYRLKRAQNHFHLMFGDFFTRIKLKKAYHIVTTYGGYDEFTEGVHPIIKKIESISALPGILSFFEGENGEEYIAIVNNNTLEPGNFRFVFDKTKITSFRRVCRNATDFPYYYRQSEEQRANAKEGEEARCDCWLAPGQIVVFVINKED